MPLVLVGVLLLVGRLAELGPMANLPWWAIAAPFVIAVLWWHFADTSGWTQRRVMEKMEQKKIDRREKAMDALGLNTRRERHATKARKEAARRTTPSPTQHDDPPGPPPPPRR